MKPKIYCVEPTRGALDFFLVVDRQEYFLFRQGYSRTVHNYFDNGIWLHEIYDFSKTKRNTILVHTLDKLPLYIKYVEKEYDITVLKQTRRKRSCRQEALRLSA